MSDGKTGIQAAVLATMEGETPFEPAEQLAFLPLSTSPTKHAEALPVDVRRGPGRPAGSRNKRTEDWVGYILGRYRSPLVAMAEIYSRPVLELAKELKTTPLEAFKLQLVALKELAPFLHQKLPQAVEVDARGLIPLVLEFPRVEGLGSVTEAEKNIVEIQGDILPPPSQLDEKKLDEVQKTSRKQRVFGDEASDLGSAGLPGDPND